MPYLKLQGYLKLAALLSLSGILLFSLPAASQTVNCSYDRTSPSLDNARLNFKSMNYRCAESEIMDYLDVASLSLKKKADAHVLLAAVYYAMLADNEQKQKEKVVEQFTAAFRQYRDWKGDLEIDKSEFAEMMAEAKQRVDRGEADSEARVRPLAGKDCPSTKTPLIASGLTAAVGVYFLIANADANSKWDDYENDPQKSDDLYDDYKSANDRKNIAGIATAAGAAVTAYLWYKYFKARGDCEEMSAHIDQPGFRIDPQPRGLALTYRF